MLDYEWGNPSTIMLSGDESTQDSDQSRQLFNNYHQSLADNHHHHHILSHPTTANNAFSHHQHHHHFLSHQQQQQQQQQHHHSHSDIQTIYDDPRHYTTTSYPNPPPAMLTLDPVTGVNGVGGDGGNGGGYMMVPKSEEMSRPGGDFTARIGLNLGHRTYFSSDDDFVNRLYRRSRPGPLDSGSVNTPRCQAEGCTSDLTHAKHYHRRHKVCEFHSKASTVIAAGMTQRFCQQCSRFHILSEFDNGKRSCRKRLADHNRRRRKSQHQQHQQQQPNHDHDHQIKSSQQPENALSISSSETLTRSPPDSGAHSTSTVTVAVSPPRMSLDCFRQRSYNGGAVSSSAASSLLFYSNE